MQLEYLREFCVWVESKTMEEAARKVHISQSTLSKHLACVESEVGVPLIQRSGTTTLTEAGICFYNGSVELLQKYRRLLRETCDLAENATATMVVWDAYVFSQAMVTLEEIMRDFLKNSPSTCTVLLRNEPYKTSLQALEDKSIDIAIEYIPAFCEGIFSDDVYTHFKLVEEKLMCWCAKDSKLGHTEHIHFEDLDGVPVMCSMQLIHPLIDSVQLMYAKHDIDLIQHRFNPTSQASFFFEAPKDCIYLITEGMRNDQRIQSRDDMVLREIEEADARVISYALWRKQTRNQAVQAFTAYVSELPRA